MEDEVYKKELGKKIKQLREKQEQRPKKFAEKCKIDRTTLYRIEAGLHTTTIITLRHIAAALKIPIGELVTL